jgi:hypothetical protein
MFEIMGALGCRKEPLMTAQWAHKFVRTSFANLQDKWMRRPQIKIS